jgi:hypothetical protein
MNKNSQEQLIDTTIQRLKKINPLVIIDYIRQMMEILINLKNQEFIENSKKVLSSSFDLENAESKKDEKYMASLEKDIRSMQEINYKLMLENEFHKSRIESQDKAIALLKLNNLKLSEVRS